MAHIPFGYRIRDGQAVIEDKEKEQLELFYRAYLEGMTIEGAGKRAGISLSRPTLGRMLQNKVYLGDDYYPPILEENLYNRVDRERQRRYEAQGRFGKRKPRPPAPVKTHFRMAKPEKTYEDAAMQASYLYGLIEAIDD